MSIISQIGVVILIAFIVLVLIRSNKNLKKASEEGENFVDEWALRQEKKEEIKQKREEKKLEVQKEKEQKKLQKKQKRKGILVDEDNEPEEYELREEKEEKARRQEGGRRRGRGRRGLRLLKTKMRQAAPLRGSLSHFLLSAEAERPPHRSTTLPTSPGAAGTGPSRTASASRRTTNSTGWPAAKAGR